MRVSVNAALAALLVCSIAASTVQASEPVKAYPALWQISDDDTTVHMLGTLHLMRPHVQWLHGDVAEAFEQADQLVLETVQPDIDEQQDIVTRVAVDHSGKTLRSKLEPDDRLRYEQALHSNGLPTTAFDAFKPWMASMTLSIFPMLQAGYRLESGVDFVLQQAAEADGKRVTGLKGFEQHLGILDSLGEPLQMAMLNDAVEQMPHVRGMIREMDALWRTGRIDELARMMADSMTGYDDSEELYAVLLSHRNRDWANWIEQRMDSPGKVFLAVGAGHLAGKRNLLELLEAKGYTVTRVQTETARID